MNLLLFPLPIRIRKSSKFKNWHVNQCNKTETEWRKTATGFFPLNCIQERNFRFFPIITNKWWCVLFNNNNALMHWMCKMICQKKNLRVWSDTHALHTQVIELIHKNSVHLKKIFGKFQMETKSSFVSIFEWNEA